MKIRHILSALVIALLLAGCGGGSPSGSDGGDDNDGGDDPPDDPSEDTTAPASPNGLEGISGDEIVELSWDANTESDLEGYSLYRSEESFSDVSDMDPVNSSRLTNESYADEDVQNGTTYYYRLTAVDDSDNESGESSQVEVTPFSDPPDRPKK